MIVVKLAIPKDWSHYVMSCQKITDPIRYLLSTDLDSILEDFSDFEGFNPFGIFHCGDHTINAGLHTNCGAYYAADCTFLK